MKGSPEAIGDRTPRWMQDIEQAASYLAQGLHPMKLDEMGDHGNAQNLRFLLSEIDSREQGDLLDTRVHQLQHKPKPTPQKPQEHTHQTDFLNRIPTGGTLTELPIPPASPRPKHKRARRSKQYTLEDLHKDSKYRPYPRQKLQMAEANRSRRQFLTAIGYTEKAKTQGIQEAAERAIERLKAAGVWDEHFTDLTKHLSARDIPAINRKLRAFDAHKQTESRLLWARQPQPDLDSSDGFTIYPSVEAWNVDHYDIAEE